MQASKIAERVGCILHYRAPPIKVSLIIVPAILNGKHNSCQWQMRTNGIYYYSACVHRTSMLLSCSVTI